MKIALLLSSVRQNRLAASVYQKIAELIGDRFEFTLVDPLELNLPMLDKRYSEMTDAEEKFNKLHTIFNEADGFLIVTAEYNHSIPPALSNMLDHFGPEFRYKSCGIVSYSNGAYGGARATEHLRGLVATLGMPAIPSSPGWTFANKADDPSGKASADAFAKSFSSFLDQFIWYTEAFIDKRAKTPAKS